MLLANYRQKDRIDVFRNCQEIIPVVQSLTFSVFYRLRLSFPSALGSYRRSKHFHKEHFPSWSRRSNSCRNVGYLVNSDGLFLLGPPPEGTSNSNPLNRNHRVLSLTLSTSLKMIFCILSKLQDPSLDILKPLLVPISLETVRMTAVYSRGVAAHGRSRAHEDKEATEGHIRCLHGLIKTCRVQILLGHREAWYKGNKFSVLTGKGRLLMEWTGASSSILR